MGTVVALYAYKGALVKDFDKTFTIHPKKEHKGENSRRKQGELGESYFGEFFISTFINSHIGF